jgi:hypothetical protein
MTVKKANFVPFGPVLLTAMLLLLFGAGGLAVVVITLLPDLAPRWLFFFLLFLALSGTSLPVVAFLHRRFPSNPPANGSVLTREAIMVGIYGNLLAWLQMGRMVTSLLAVGLALGFIFLETLIRLRENTRWKPEPDEADNNGKPA